MPITMTPAAVDEVKQIRASSQLDDKTFLRISVLGGGCSGIQYSLNFDTEFDTAADTFYVFDGVKLATMKKFDPHFDGTRIDFINDETGSGFDISNPNFPKSAGCAGCGH